MFFIIFAVRDSFSRGHDLGFSCGDCFLVAHAVLVCDSSGYDNGDYFHVVVGVGVESFAGGNDVFVDDSERAIV